MGAIHSTGGAQGCSNKILPQESNHAPALRPSSRNNPCPVCRRTMDADCRISDDLVICHRGHNNHPPEGLRPGDVIDGNDGQRWAYTGESKDGRAAVFTLDKPRLGEHWEPARSIPPKPLKLELALLPEPITDIGSPYAYSNSQRVYRVEGKSGKRFHCEHHDGRSWRRGAGPDAWPLWNEAKAIAHGRGKWISEAEGEKCACILMAGGVVATTQPGHAHNPAQVQVRYERLKGAGVAGVVFLADNDAQGSKRADEARQAAEAIGLDYLMVPAADVWPGLPAGGSIDDAPGTPTERVAVLAAAIRTRCATAKPAPAPPRVHEPTLAERIAAGVEDLLRATLAEDENAIDAAKTQLFRLGISKERAQERTLRLWAEHHGINLAGQQQKSAPLHGRCIGKGSKPTSSGLRQQLPGFGIDRDLHLVAADAGAGKTLALAELAIVMSARDRGFLDHEAPRTDSDDDPRRTVLVIASDSEGTAYQMWETYLEELGAEDREAQIEIWAEDPDTGEQPWVASLPGLERLEQRLKSGDLAAVIIDTANSVLRGADINTGVGPVEAYLRLLKKIVCRYCPLWISHHTTRIASPDIKGIGGHPAFQEVPSVIHLIETKKQSDGTQVRLWHVLKLRGSDYRRFAYENHDGVLKVTEGHFHENCSQQVLTALHQQRLVGSGGRAADLIQTTKRPANSVSAALQQLRLAKLIRRKGTGYWLTPTGQAMAEALRF
jgi:hypothetical protein